MKQQLKNLAKRHGKLFGDMRSKNATEFKNKEEEFSKDLMELEWKQDVEIKDAITADEDQLAEALQVQERELALVCRFIPFLILHFRKPTFAGPSQRPFRSDEC